MSHPLTNNGAPHGPSPGGLLAGKFVCVDFSTRLWLGDVISGEDLVISHHDRELDPDAVSNPRIKLLPPDLRREAGARRRAAYHAMRYGIVVGDGKRLIALSADTRVRDEWNAAAQGIYALGDRVADERDGRILQWIHEKWRPSFEDDAAFHEFVARHLPTAEALRRHRDAEGNLLDPKTMQKIRPPFCALLRDVPIESTDRNYTGVALEGFLAEAMQGGQAYVEQLAELARYAPVLDLLEAVQETNAQLREGERFTAGTFAKLDEALCRMQASGELVPGDIRALVGPLTERLARVRGELTAARDTGDTQTAAVLRHRDAMLQLLNGATGRLERDLMATEFQARHGRHRRALRPALT